MSYKIIFVADIFGKNQNLQTLINDCLIDDVYIIDPYQGQEISFDGESLAYQAFIEQGGLESYTLQLKKYLAQQIQPVKLIGFSAGASAIWQLLSESSGVSNKIIDAICFYPGQIRYFTDIVPAVNTHVVFPGFESHFELEPIIDVLRNKQNLSLINTDLEHGFMNKKKSIFNQDAYDHFCQFIINTDK